MLYSLLWVIFQRLSFMCRRFGTLCLFHLHRLCKLEEYKTLDSYKFIVRILPVTSCILIGG